MIDNKGVILNNLNEILKENRISQVDLSQKTEIDQGNLSAILKGNKPLGDKTLLKIAKALEIDYEELRNPPPINAEERKGKYVVQRKNTYQADTLKLPDFVGETTEIVFLKKLEYLTYIGKMRADGMLDEEEFMKIKSRLINLL